MAKQNPGDAGPHDGEQAGQAAGPLAGEPRRRPSARATPWHRRTVIWLTWWVILMSLWVAVDDSFESDELLVGAGVAAFAALAAELVGDQAGLRLQVRARWLVRALGLPGEVAQQTVTVFAALARTMFTRTPPRGRFRELPVKYGDDTPLGVTRRVLLTGALSLAPNEFVLGIDAERDVMVTHQLVEER
jgi:multisubunit Na+/H+ antiporter MnhE subunit